MRFRDEAIGAVLAFVAAVICAVCVLPSHGASLDVERARMHAAASVALLTPELSPTPGPGPSPEPSGQCERCRGTGRIKPDGRIEIACPDCGGDGVTSYGDLSAVLKAEREMMAREIGQIKSLVSGVGREVKKVEQKTEQNNQRLDNLINQADEIISVEERMRDLKDSLRASQPVAPEPSSPAAARINWFDDLSELKAESQRTGKPALVFWTGDGCTPCEMAKIKLFRDPDVVALLADSFVCAEINASRKPKSLLRKWNIVAVPTYCYVDPEWTTFGTLKRTQDPAEFVRQLENELQTVRPKVKAKSAVFRSASESEPVTGIDDTVTEVQTKPTQYFIVQGNGSTGGSYSNGSAGVSYSMSGNGSAGGGYSGGYGSYYQPAYYSRPRSYYSSPSYGWGGGGYYGGGYGGGGGSMVCSGGVCYFQ